MLFRRYWASSGLKCFRKLWASKLPHTISSQLIKFSKNRQFLITRQKGNEWTQQCSLRDSAGRPARGSGFADPNGPRSRARASPPSHFSWARVSVGRNWASEVPWKVGLDLSLPRKKISGERWRVGGKKSRFTVNLREMYLRQTERNFTRPSYTCLKCLQVTSDVFAV